MKDFRKTRAGRSKSLNIKFLKNEEKIFQYTIPAEPGSFASAGKIICAKGSAGKFSYS